MDFSRSLTVTFSLISLCSKDKLYMILILWNLFQYVLWPRKWIKLVHVPRALQKNVCSSAILDKKCCCDLILNWFLVYLFYELLWKVLRLPKVTVNLSSSPLSSTSFCFMYIESLLLNTYTHLRLLYLLGEMTPLSLCDGPFAVGNNHCPSVLWYS